MEWNVFYNSYSRMTDVDLRDAVMSLDDIGSGEEVTDVLTDISNAAFNCVIYNLCINRFCCRKKNNVFSFSASFFGGFANKFFYLGIVFIKNFNR